MAAWPVIDNKVRVFKHEGGPVDEAYGIVAAGCTIAYLRLVDERAYLFYKTGSGRFGYVSFGSSDVHGTSIEKRTDRLEWLLTGCERGLRAMDKDLVIMSPAVFYMEASKKQWPPAKSKE